MAGSNRKKKRAPKTSKGVNGGGGKVRNLSPVQLVNMGKGLLKRPIKRDMP